MLQTCALMAVGQKTMLTAVGLSIYWGTGPYSGCNISCCKGPHNVMVHRPVQACHAVTGTCIACRHLPVPLSGQARRGCSCLPAAIAPAAAASDCWSSSGTSSRTPPPPAVPPAVTGAGGKRRLQGRPQAPPSSSFSSSCWASSRGSRASGRPHRTSSCACSICPCSGRSGAWQPGRVTSRLAARQGHQPPAAGLPQQAALPSEWALAGGLHLYHAMNLVHTPAAQAVQVHAGPAAGGHAGDAHRVAALLAGRC